MTKHTFIMVMLVATGALAGDDAGDVTNDAGAAVVAEPQIPVSEPPDLLRDGEPSLVWSLVQTLVVLALVVGLAWLTLNVGLRRLLGLGPMGRRGVVTVLERVPLDQRRTLFVVRVGDEVLLLGASDASVSVLTKLDAKVLEAAQPNGPPISSPLLQKVLGKNEDPKVPPTVT